MVLALTVHRKWSFLPFENRTTFFKLIHRGGGVDAGGQGVDGGREGGEIGGPAIQRDEALMGTERERIVVVTKAEKGRKGEKGSLAGSHWRRRIVVVVIRALRVLVRPKHISLSHTHTHETHAHLPQNVSKYVLIFLS